MRHISAVAALLVACTDPGVGPGGVDPSNTDDPPGCATLAPQDEGDFLARDTIVSGWRMDCRSAVHAAAGAIGSTLEVRLDQWNGDGAARLVATDLLGEPLAEEVAEAGDVIEVTLPQSGEVLVRLEPEDPDAPANGYALVVTCEEACDVEYTRYPIVMLHGAGPDQVVGVDYFYGIGEALGARGFLVVTPSVDPFAGTEQRGADWAKHLDDLVAQGVGRKFDLIGHSQGGVDARYVIGHLGYEDRVAALITVASPHRGTSVADVSAGLIDLSPIADDLVEAAVDGIASLFGLSDQDTLGALASLNTLAMAEFNAETPDAPGVYYSSWAGHSCGILEPSCIAAHGGEVVTPFLGPTYTLLALTDGPNDGMVPVSSAIWADFQGEVPADHFDEVGQLIGLTPAAFDHRAFYLSEARRLAALGF